MPELPEVETTRRGLEPYVLHNRVAEVVVRQRNLRWPVQSGLESILKGQSIQALSRRGKYLVFEARSGSLIVHLGMSGSLRLVGDEQPARRHDHIDIRFADGRILRYHDPRRFGSVHWTTESALLHPLLCALGPEPLGNAFSGNYLYEKSRQRTLAIKSFIMDSRVVVGVGNIYASEALHMAGVRPGRAAGRISQDRYSLIEGSIRSVLGAALAQGGTTLRDFVNGVGEPGYFAQSLRVYGRAGEPCRECGESIALQTIGQRASYFCRKCQR